MGELGEVISELGHDNIVADLCYAVCTTCAMCACYGYVVYSGMYRACLSIGLCLDSALVWVCGI